MLILALALSVLVAAALVVYLPSARQFGLRSHRLVLLAEFLANITRRGHPLPEGLDAFGADIRGWLGQSLRQMSQHLRAGKTLGDAAMGARGVIPSRLAATIRAGEKTGTLPELMSLYAAQDADREEADQKTSLVVIYPLFTSLLLLAFAQGVSLNIHPRMAAMYSEMGLYLPGVMSLHVGTAVLLAVAVCVLLLILGHRLDVLFADYVTPSGSYSMPSLLNRLLGRSRRLRATATFCETLGILLDRGTPTAEAVAQAAEVGAYGMPDLSLARVAASVKEGGRLPDAMVSELRLGKPETWILRATGAGPELPNGLREVARLCRDRATSRQTSVRECILPVLISLEGIGVLLVALGMLLPVFHLSAMLGG